MQQSIPPFKPEAVPIVLTLNYQQINLVLEGLGLMPYDKVAGLYAYVQTVGIQALKEAQEQHQQIALPLSTEQEPQTGSILPTDAPPPADNLPSDQDWEQATGQAKA